ncbi:MAG: FlgD immunoglobulin-like domain containing protein, partial [Nitrososphaera sp.]
FLARLEAESPLSTITLQVPPQDHFFNLENHGLAKITFVAKETIYEFVADTENRGREGNVFYIPVQGSWTVDFDTLWGNNENLQITLSAEGRAGQYAYAIFSDQPWDFTNPLEETPNARLTPQRFALWPSYPNPFNPSTTIRFDVAAENQHVVSLKIFNLQGQLVATLLNGWVAAGEYELVWHGRDNNNFPVSSGVYLCVLQAGNYRASRKMTLLR